MIAVSKFESLSSNGSQIKLPADTVVKIKRLVLEVCGKHTAAAVPTSSSSSSSSLSSSLSTTSLSTTSEPFPSKQQMVESHGLRRRRDPPPPPVPVNQANDSHDWESLRSFALTKRVTKAGVDITKDTLRSLINRLTEDTYDETCLELIEVVSKDIMVDDILQIIFDIAISNRFFSELYARVFAFLASQFNLQKAIQNFVDTFCAQYFNLDLASSSSSSSSSSYDAFCDALKETDKRKGAAALLSYLVKQKVVKRSYIDKTLNYLFSFIENAIDRENQKTMVEEAIECVYIFLSVDSAISAACLDNLKRYATSGTKAHPSLSAKAIFKAMDVVDMLK